MTYYYPLENLTSSTNLTGVADYANEVTGDIFWMVIIFAMWIVLFMATYRPKQELESFTTASFITSIASYFLAAMTLVTPGAVIIPTAITVFGVLAMARRPD